MRLRSAELCAAAPTRVLRRVLVANRGEIARRVLRSARARGITTVAVFDGSDVAALHVREADAAVALAGRGAAAYLDVDSVVDAALRSGADCVHPGYGFLSENPTFAEAVTAAGLVWIGPPPDAMRSMASKLEAKRIAAGADVPLLPSAPLDGDDPAAWHAAADGVGYPLLVKASAGGGGKGMRLVDDAAALDDAVRGARREAASSFGDDTVYVERAVAAPRHVEVQVLADVHGTVWTLGERECSIQRRHQKLVEETPSPAVDDMLRTRLCDAAASLARRIGYVGAGTVEFLVDGDDCFFLEVNTRLQVEHPVTEAVWGVDLVALQFDVAAGARLGAQPVATGAAHAIEVRLCAEDPARDFLPSTGTLTCWELDAADAGDPTVRLDDGVTTGSDVTPLFDPMLAKLIVAGDDRTAAALHAAAVADRMRIHGVVTNRDFLAAVLRSDAFLAGDTTTAFVAQHPELLDRAPAGDAKAAVLCAAALHGIARRRATDATTGFATPSWRLQGPGVSRSQWHDGDAVTDVAITWRRDGSFDAVVDGVEHAGVVHAVDAADDGAVDMTFDGLRGRQRVAVSALRGGTMARDFGDEGGDVAVDGPWGHWQSCEALRFPSPDATVGAGGPTAPVPGAVVAVEVAVGDRVAAGDVLVVMEAMKMEHRIEAPADAVVAEVCVAPGDSVDAHQVLVRLEAPASPDADVGGGASS